MFKFKSKQNNEQQSKLPPSTTHNSKSQSNLSVSHVSSTSKISKVSNVSTVSKASIGSRLSQLSSSLFSFSDKSYNNIETDSQYSMSSSLMLTMAKLRNRDEEIHDRIKEAILEGDKNKENYLRREHQIYDDMNDYRYIPIICDESIENNKKTDKEKSKKIETSSTISEDIFKNLLVNNLPFIDTKGLTSYEDEQNKNDNKKSKEKIIPDSLRRQGRIKRSSVFVNK